MEFNETPKTKAERRKEKIRARHRGLCADDVEYIAPREKVSIFDETSPQRVVVYVRVSTDDEKQISSFELQKSYYEDFVKEHPNWELVEIYSDEGISGTSLNNRDNFKRMIEDCKNPKNKINLIVVKSVSRFARNLEDCISHVRKLADLRPPIGIYFEIERMFTLNEYSEQALISCAQFAEQESRHKSTLLKDAYVKRSRYGIVWTPELLGYDLDDDDNLVINEEEAVTVRLIFFMYLYGYTCAEIAEKLMELGLRTKGRNADTGEYNIKWSAGTVLSILQNERHCGEILTQKSWTPNFRSHKSIKNRQDLPQYRKRNHHEPIISRDDFIAVQHLISNAKYGNKGILPQLKVITEGALQGFVSLNPRWAAFDAKAYKEASLSALPNCAEKMEREIDLKPGDLDLRGFEVVRSQFLDTARKKCITFSINQLLFSSECLRKFNNTSYVEILINPIEQLLAVRSCAKEYRNAVRWVRIIGDSFIPRNVSGAAFLKTLYEIFNWDVDCKYRVRGITRTKGKETVIIFDMRETEIFIPTDIVESNNLKPEKPVEEDRNGLRAYPPAWAGNYGQEYYSQLQARELAAIDLDGKWDITEEGKPYGETNVTSEAELVNNIETLISTITNGEKNDE